MAFSEETKNQVRDRTDIVALIGESVRLKRVGASFKGLCPFHTEKSPSFYVHPQRQMFKCFGCGVGGDVFSFVQKLDGKTFPEALRTLAERSGVELPEVDQHEVAEERRARARKERLYEILDAAAGFYVQQLDAHPLGAMARTELARRGVTDETARKFRLGYAPHGWDALARFFSEQGFSPQDGEEVGLLAPRRTRDGHYDRFRHRLLFPIADVNGRIVAFSGRILPPPPGEAAPTEGEAAAKYVNSPETSLYHKGDILFGLHEGRVAIRRSGWVILCEGNFDLVALHQAGFENSVAPMGTALTGAQTKLLRRFAERAVLLFDGDAAGAKAARSAFPLLQEAGLSAQVVTLPRGEDPDAFLRARGREALDALIESAPSIVVHLVDETADRATQAGGNRAAAIESLGPVIGSVPDVERGPLIERVARRFGITDLQAVRSALRKGFIAARAADRKPARAPVSPPSDEPKPAPQPAQPPRQAVRPDRLELDAVGLLFDVPALLVTPAAQKLAEVLTSPDLRAILTAATRMQERAANIGGEHSGAGQGRIHGPELMDAIGDSPLRGWVETRLLREEHAEEGASGALERVVAKLESRSLMGEAQRLSREIERSLVAGDHDKAMQLTRERDVLTRRAAQIQTLGTER